MKVKELIEELQRMDPEATVYVKVEGRTDTEDEDMRVLLSGHYAVDAVKPGGKRYASDVSILMDEN